MRRWRARAKVRATLCVGAIVGAAALGTLTLTRAGANNGGAQPAQTPAGSYKADPEKPDYLPGKRKNLEEAEKANAPKRARPTAQELEAIRQQYNATHPSGDGPPITGIANAKQSPLPRVYDVNNQWSGLVEAQWVEVYAGALAQDPQHGFIWILRNEADARGGPKAGAWQGGPGQFIDAPTTIGGFRIESESGVVLTVVAGSGARFALDVKTGSLTAS